MNITLLLGISYLAATPGIPNSPNAQGISTLDDV